MYMTSRRPGSLAQMTQRQLAFCFCSSNYSRFKNNTQGIINIVKRCISNNSTYESSKNMNIYSLFNYVKSAQVQIGGKTLR